MLNSCLPADVRQLCRDGKFDAPTPRLALGYVQANLVVLPYSLAFEFLLAILHSRAP